MQPRPSAEILIFSVENVAVPREADGGDLISYHTTFVGSDLISIFLYSLEIIVSYKVLLIVIF